MPIESTGSEDHPEYNIDSSLIVQPGGQIIFAFLNGSISPSEATEALLTIDASNPRLAQPDWVIVVIQTEEKMHAIMSSILDAWLKSIEEEADRIKAELKSPRYLAWLELHSPIAIAKAERDTPEELKIAIKSGSELEDFISSLPEDDKYKFLNLDDRYIYLTGLSAVLAITIQNEIGASETNDSTISLTTGPATPNLAAFSPDQFIVAALVIGGGTAAYAQGITDVSSTSQVEARLILDAWNATNPNANDPATLVAGWFSAMWGVGLIYQLSAAGIGNIGPDGGGEKKDLNFAKNYAQVLLDSLDSPQFNNGLLAIITKAMENSPESKDKSPEELVAKAKLVLIATALALIIKLEEGTTSDLSFAGVVKGDTDVEAGDEFDTAEIKNKLITAFNEAKMGIPESEREQVVYNILTYIHADPDVEELLDQQQVIADALNPTTDADENVKNSTPA